MAHVFLRADTLAHAYRYSRINPRITQTKAAVADKVDILNANGFQMHLIIKGYYGEILRSGNLRKKNALKRKKSVPEDSYLTDAVQRAIFCINNPAMS